MLDFPIQRGPSLIEGLEDLCKYLSVNLNSLNTMVEVGSFAGESTQVFEKYFKKIYAVDPWEKQDHPDYKEDGSDVFNAEKHFDTIFKNSNIINKIKKRSNIAFKDFDDNSLDFVYIDAMHTYDAIIEDIECWYPKVKSNYYIGGHDYNEGFFPQIIKAVNEKFNEPIILFKDNSWLCKKEQYKGNYIVK